MNVPQIAQTDNHLRQSRDSVWPLRGADGRTFAERAKDSRKAYRNKEQGS